MIIINPFNVRNSILSGPCLRVILKANISIHDIQRKDNFRPFILEKCGFLNHL